MAAAANHIINMPVLNIFCCVREFGNIFFYLMSKDISTLPSRDVLAHELFEFYNTP